MTGSASTLVEVLDVSSFGLGPHGGGGPGEGGWPDSGPGRRIIIQILAFLRVIGTCGGLITRILRMIVPLAP